MYHAAQPIATIKRQIVIIPSKSHLEPGFFHCLLRVWNIARNTGAQVDFYATASSIRILKRVIKKVNIEATFNEINSWKEVETVLAEISDNQGLIMLMAKRGMASYFPQMSRMPALLNKDFLDKNYLLVYPYQRTEIDNTEERSVNNHGDFTEIGNIVGRLFK